MAVIWQWLTERIADARNFIDYAVPAIGMVPVRHHGERAVRQEDDRASVAWRGLDVPGDLLNHGHLLPLA